MTPGQFERWLRKQGIVVIPARGKGGHKLLENPTTGATSILPTGSKQLKKGTMDGIRKALGLK
jgi:predicted RNA binding protein YcfA (HicA-like mRNA interferase family)